MLATCAHTPFGRITASTLRLSHTASALEMLKISHNLLATTKRLRQQLASERREFTRAMSKARRDLRHERERLVAAGCKPASAWSAFFPSKDRSKSHPLPHKGKDKSKLPLQTGAVCPAGWTVSDANLTPQKHWLSFHQRNLIGNEILKINSNQNTDAFHKKAEVSKRKVLFSFCTCISKSKNPHQIPGNRNKQLF